LCYAAEAHSERNTEPIQCCLALFCGITPPLQHIREPGI
jgi:hypothetical protein